MSSRFDDYLRPRALLWWPACLLLALFLGWADYWTGDEALFTLFYLIPVAWAAWSRGLSVGLLFSGIVTAESVAALLLQSVHYRHAAILYWNAFGSLGIFVAAALLLSTLRRQLARAQEMARTDALTGLANRRSFLEAASVELARARRFATAVTIVYFDVDEFKSINDRFGHDAGDRLLVAIATLLRMRLRAFDLTARLGGDEFAALLVTTDSAGAHAVLRDIRERIATDVGMQSFSASVSIGAVTFEQAPDEMAAALARADQLMFEAKKDGRGRLRHEAVPSERRA